MNVLDLFSGIGGFSLGLESTGGFRTVAFCEIEPFPRAVLRKHWPNVPIHDDVRTLRGEDVGDVDIICGGFPCQDVSVAGKGAGLDGARSGLWREYARIVGELRPRWVLAENVGALRTRGIDRVCSDLEAQGYAVWPLVVGAWAVGAPHRRERVWIVARALDATTEARRERQRVLGADESGLSGQARLGARVGHAEHDDGWADQPRRGQEGRTAARRASASELDNSDAGRRGRSEHALQAGRDEPVGTVSAVGLADRHSTGQHRQRSGGLLDGERAASGDDADGRGEWPVGSPTGSGLAHGRMGSEPARAQQSERHGSGLRWPARPGEPQHEWEPARLAQFKVGELPDGLPARLVRTSRRRNREALKAYGNSVVSQVVAVIGRAILEADGALR